MMLIDTLVTVLLATGIFSSAAARGHTLRGPKFLPPERDAASRSVDFYIEILDPANYVNFSREQCEEHGGSDAYDVLVTSLQQFQANVQTLVKPLRREIETALVHPRGRLPFVVKKYCRRVPTLQKYINRVTESIQACLDEAGVHRVIGDRYFVNAFLDYICQDEGSGLARFITDDGMECLTSKKQGVINCAEESFSHYLSGGEFDGDVVSEVKGFEMLFALDIKRCDEVGDFQRCVTGVLNDCQEPTTREALNRLIDDLIIKVTSCQTSNGIGEVERLLPTISQNVSSEDGDFESLMLEKCELMGGGPLAYNSIRESFKMISQVSKMFDLRKVQYEIEYAAFKSNLDSAVALYCRTVPIVIGIEKFITDTFKSCLAPYELGMDIFHNVASSLLEAACYNDGNAIAAFVAGDGVQCMESKRRELESCAREIFGGYFEAGGWRKRAMPETPFVIDLKDCEDMERLRKCSIQALDECEDKTASYMMNSVFHIVHDGMSCEELRKAKLPSKRLNPELRFNSMKEELLKSCENNMTYETVKDVLQHMDATGRLVFMNIEQFEVDFKKAQQHGGIEVLIKKYCRKIPAFKKFLKHARDTVLICLQRDGKMNAGFEIDLLITYLDFMCDNEGDRAIKLFTSDGGVDCIESKVPLAVQTCMPKRYSSGHSGFTKLREDLDAKECGPFKEIQHCVVQTFNECHDPTAAQTVDDLMDSLIKDSGCSPTASDTD